MHVTLTRFKAACVMLVAVLCVSNGTFSRAAEDRGAGQRPRLFVLVVFDQMRGDYLIRWQPHFADGGFQRLLKEGAWFQNCHYPYAGTLTGAGHASLLAGCTPSTHGIVANEWYVRTTRASLNCVGSLKYDRVPLPGGAASEGSGKVSPENLQAATFGDVLKAATGGDGRIVGISLKDRSAVLPAGKSPNACYWFDATTGSFVTSSYYAPQLHPWLEKFNQARPADAYFGQDWIRFREDLDYENLIGPDDVKGEGSGAKQGRTFPHAMKGGLEKPGPEFYKAVYTSPSGNQLLLSLAKAAIEGEQLGTDEVPDLLTISFSSNDAVGHAWGPDSQEVFDITLRSDALMKELLEYLDLKVGRDRYLLALSADHGVCSIPEVALAQGKDAGRVSPGELRQGADAFLEAEFGGGGTAKPKWIETFSNGWFYFDTKKLQAAGITSAQAAYGLSQWLRQQRGIYAAYTREQLQGDLVDTDVLGQRVRLSYFPEHCGDVVIVLRPNWLLGDNTTGTTHGSPYGYDSHVPLLIYGSRVQPAVRQERVSPTAIAPIFAHGLGASPPAGSTTPLPEDVLLSD